MIELRRIALPLALAAAASVLPTLAADMVMMNPGDIKWGEAPPNVPKGAKIAVLFGDPGKPGPWVGRLMMPAHYKIAPHWHTTAESLTIISGSFYLGHGDKMDTKAATALKAGGYHYLPAKEHHYAFTKGPAVVQINAEGPFDINYINPDDDPSKAAAAAKPAAPAKAMDKGAKK